MICLIDNYDSFTFNLVHYFGELGAEVRVHRNDKITSAAIVAADPDAIVLSPGPCTPKEAGICLDLIAPFPAKSRSSASALATRRSAKRSAARSCGRQSRSWQALRDPPRRHRHFSRHQRASRLRAIICSWLIAQVAGRSRREREHRRRIDHGACAPAAAGAWRAISPRRSRRSGHLMLKNFLDIAASWNASSGRRMAAPQKLRERN